MPSTNTGAASRAALVAVPSAAPSMRGVRRAANTTDAITSTAVLAFHAVESASRGGRIADRMP